MNQSLGHSLPIELVREIMTWVFQFQQAELTDRIRVFKSSYSNVWSTVLGDIRMNVPHYTAFLIGTGGTQFSLSVYSPQCDPTDWMGVIQQPMIRRALSVHCEFLTDTLTNRGQYSLMNAENSVVHGPPE